MLANEILNSSASLNDFDVIGSLEFIPGEATILVIRLTQPQRDDQLRYVADSGATLNVILPNKDGTDLTKAMSAITDDRSMWSVALSAVETAALASGNFTFELTEGGTITKGFYENGLAIVITGGC